jgi:para-aminobenzoate synthetase/4-amino-4-deoxychorismate lyase
MRGSTLVQDVSAGGWWQFGESIEILAAHRKDEVLPVLREVAAKVERDRVWAAGFVSYEASPAFDPAMHARPAGVLPLVWFGLHREPRLLRCVDRITGEHAPAYHWTPTISRDQYDATIDRVRSLIAAGVTYQVNYSFRLRASMKEEPEALFRRMVQASSPQHAAYLDCGRFIICSASPELFFRLDGDQLTSRPMKGTAGRGLYLDDDNRRACRLAASIKDRAENVMIVDIMRNDMGRISRTGSVAVPRLFELECYPTVWQMTSTVTSETVLPVAEIVASLFPSASITGAPKAKTTELIAQLETTPRGVYTGCIGYIAPGRRAQFSVAIRTAVVDRNAGSVEYAVGSGIVWDSVERAEYEECMVKARIVTDAPPPAFSMLETILWEPARGYFLLDAHLGRLAESSHYLGVRLDLDRVRRELQKVAASFGAVSQRVRLLVHRDGGVFCESAPIETNSSKPVRLAIAVSPIDPADPFLYNKTTCRAVYEKAKAAVPPCDDVVLWNRNNEVTETTIANIVVEVGGEKLTPPVKCGLLPGVFRGLLLSRGEVREQSIAIEDLRTAQRIWVVNSVRKWRVAELAN